MASWSDYSMQLGFRKFNLKLIIRVTGILLIYLSAGMVIPIIASLYYKDGAQFALILSAVLILMAGLLMRNMLGRDAEYDLRESESYWMAVVTWLAVPLCGTLPYIFTGGIGSFTDAVFESYSGFTTTGSSVLTHPEEIPQSLLLYRAFTQWVGGLGLMLFVLAILTKLTMGSVQIYEAEFSGTQQRKLHPRMSKNVIRMWTIYILLTVVMIVMLLLTGTPLVDSICLSFSTVSTGGFATHSTGLAILSNGSLMVMTIFMLLSGINVAMLYRFFTFKWRHLGKDEELGTYLILYVVVVVICSLAFIAKGNDNITSLQYSIFHVASTMSTCGFHVPKPMHWSFVVSVITFVLIVMGATSGSTGGGIKLRRILILAKYLRNYFTRMLHPNAVFRVKVNSEVVENDYINKVFAFVFLYIFFIIIGAFVLTLCGCTIPDATCMAAANISNLGPSSLINSLGGSLNYSQLPMVAKWTLTVLMLAGRLELFALIAVFSPTYWRRK